MNIDQLADSAIRAKRIETLQGFLRGLERKTISGLTIQAAGNTTSYLSAGVAKSACEKQIAVEAAVLAGRGVKL